MLEVEQEDPLGQHQERLMKVTGRELKQSKSIWLTRIKS